MASDCAGILAAFALFSLFAVAPGYTLAWLLDLLSFRTRSLPCRLALSVAFSISIGPLASYFLTRWLSSTAALIVFGMLALPACVLLVRERWPRGLDRKILGVITTWVALAVLSLTDLQIGHRLYFSVIAFDYAIRIAFTHSIAAFGVPARSPFFYPGHPVPLRYHYFWLIEPALLAKSGLDERLTLMGATIWSGIGLICIVALYLRFFSPTGAILHAKRTVIGVALLAVTGLDLFPSLLLLWLAKTSPRGVLPPSVEWWNDQVDGFLHTALWEPHYIAGLTACLTGFLLLWNLPAKVSRRLVAAAVAGLAFGTCVGAAIYVALVFAAFLLIWLAISLIRKWYRDVALVSLSGLVALLVSLPFLHGLSGPVGDTVPLHLTMRRFYLAEGILQSLGWSQPWQVFAADLILLPLNYFLELGFFFAIAILLWKQRASSRHQLAAFSMLATSVLICTFVKSGIVENNDLGWRGFLLAQFVLLIAAADFLCLGKITSSQKSGLVLLLLFGAAGTAYDLALLRFYPVLSDAEALPHIAWLAPDEKLGLRTDSNREAYEWLKANTPTSVIIQQNPNPALQDTFYGLYAGRQTVAQDHLCTANFGGDPVLCPPLVVPLTALFTAASPAAFESTCKTLALDYIVAKDTDVAWRNPGSWVWTRRPAFANSFVRLFPCRPISYTPIEKGGR